MHRLCGVLAIAKGCGGTPSPDSGTEPPPPPPADWVVGIDPATMANHVAPALLGQYDLSGSLLHYQSNTSAVDAMKAIGFPEWRVGVGRWEFATRMLPTLTDGTSCAASLAQLPAILDAPPGSTDTTLVADRDWFTDNGTQVTLADTNDDTRYSLAYLGSVLDTAAAFGATPYIDLDHMPRALSANRTFSRVGMPQGVTDPCTATWVNHVSNARPASADVFSSAVVGLVRRVVESGRNAPYWELWNEPEFGYAWDQSFEQPPGTLNAFFQAMIATLVKLDAYRTSSTDPRAKMLHFGLGSFGQATTAVGVIAQFDAAATHIPVDFVSFHSYSNDPLVIVADIQSVVNARASSAHYQSIELALSEWGPSLGSPPSPTTMDIPLLVSTVLARGATLGLDRAHHTFFYDYIPGFAFTLIGSDGSPKPLYRAYQLLHELIGSGADRLAIAGASDGAFDAGMGAAIAARGGDGLVRVLLVNRGDARTARVDLAGTATMPSKIEVFDDPASAPHDVTPATQIAVPAKSIVLVTM
jgi:hypothetical protein